MFAEVEALVGGVDDDGIFGESGLVKMVEDLGDAFIHGADDAEVVFDVALVFPFRNGFLVEFAGLHVSDELGVFVIVSSAVDFFVFF